MEIEGILRREDLFERGYTRAGIERAVNDGGIKRVAHGWYAQPWANRDVVRALESGGRLGCLSGCRFWGLWVPEDHELHVVFPSGKVAEGAARKIQVCAHVRSGRVADGPVWPLLDCLDHVIRFHDSETALVVIESAVHKGLITSDDAVVLLASHPKKARLLTKHLDAAESGSETRVRLFLRRNQVAVKVQVWLTGKDRVDLLVGKSLVIECDSKEFHSSQRDYEKDRERDARLRALGYDIWRLSYGQIWHEWEAIQLHIQSEIRMRGHLKEPKPRA